MTFEAPKSTFRALWRSTPGWAYPRITPTRAAGYVRLAELLWYRAKRARSLDDLRQARHLLQHALRNADDSADYDIERRLKHLQEDIASFDSEATRGS